MKIVIVCMQYDYGERARGYSFEYMHFYQVLMAMGHEVILFDFVDEMRVHGRCMMNHRLIECIKEHTPDLAFFVLYQDEIKPDTVKTLRDYTKTVCFFHDDTWRIDYSRFWASQFDYFTTPDVYGEYKYQHLGLNGAIHFPFGCNTNLFKKLPIEKTIDVSFVGAWHPYRAWLLSGLKRLNLRVEVAGYGWPRGPISHHDMVILFNRSKINLNLSNSTCYDIRYLAAAPKAIINTLRSPKNIEQLKARVYEINACGAFQLSYYVEGLERQYTIGEEMGIYTNKQDLLDKVSFYLTHQILRENMAEKALQKSKQLHSYESRFKHLFERMGF